MDGNEVEEGEDKGMLGWCRVLGFEYVGKAMVVRRYA